MGHILALVVFRVSPADKHPVSDGDIHRFQVDAQFVVSLVYQGKTFPVCSMPHHRPFAGVGYDVKRIILVCVR
jgi:hypothetical protein